MGSGRTMLQVLIRNSALQQFLSGLASPWEVGGRGSRSSPHLGQKSPLSGNSALTCQ